jgi:hypothetical protein
MRRWVAVGAVGWMLASGCSSQTATQRPVPDAPPAVAGTVETPSVSGTLIIPDGWTYDLGDFPRTVHDGEECLLVGDRDAEGDGLGVLLVVVGSAGATLGTATFGPGEISGLGIRGFDLPDQLEAALIAGDRLRQHADCLFEFIVGLSGESQSYSFVVDGKGVSVFSHDDLESLGWVADLTHG